MIKAWDKMTEIEKLESLRSDVSSIKDAVNGIAERFNQLVHSHHEVKTLLTEVAEAVEKVETVLAVR